MTVSDSLLQPLLQIGATHVLEITGISHAAAGIGRVDGVAVFVEQALPGERVEARIRKCKKHYAVADLCRVIVPHPDRVLPDCANYGRCGGCAFRHLSYEAELELKRQIVVQALQRVGGIDFPVPLPMAAPVVNGYRNRASFHIAPKPTLQMGFFQKNSHSICQIEQCLLLHPALTQVWQTLIALAPVHREFFHGLREIVLRVNSSGQQLCLIFVADRAAAVPEDLLHSLTEASPGALSVWQNTGKAQYSIYGRTWQHVLGPEYFEEQLDELCLQLSPASFCQVNHAQTRVLYQLVLDYAGLSGGEAVLDLYSGVGSIALFLAPHCRSVLGVESYAPAVADATANAQRNNIANSQFYCADAKDLQMLLADTQFQPDVVILDPPRAGCDTAVLDAVLQLAVKRVVYVSCDPATLARDLRRFSAEGYAIEKVQPVDMFSRTQHVETVVLLSKLGPAKSIES